MTRGDRRLAKTAPFALVIITIAAGMCAAQNAPQVLKVEPPSWWANHSINPVRVLIKGKNFESARVEATGGGVTAKTAHVNAAGTYVFVDLIISPQAQPGERSLKISTSQGSVSARFEILPRLDRTGRFQGFTTDDVIYLIMTDRFSDGDPSNNDPPESRGLYDRSKPRYYHGGDFEGVI